MKKIIKEFIGTDKDKMDLAIKTIQKLESGFDKFIPVDKLAENLKKQMTFEELNRILDKMLRLGEIFYPKKDFIQRV